MENVDQAWVDEQICQNRSKPKRYNGTMPTWAGHDDGSIRLLGWSIKIDQGLTLEECFRYLVRVEGVPLLPGEEDDPEEEYEDTRRKSWDRVQAFRRQHGDPISLWEYSQGTDRIYRVVLYFSAEEILQWFEKLRSSRGERKDNAFVILREPWGANRDMPETPHGGRQRCGGGYICMHMKL